MTCSPQDSPASRFRSPDSERERMMTATSGRRLSELYTKSDPLGLLERTLLESSRWFSPARRLKWEAVPLCSEKITEKEYCCGKNTSSKPCAVTLNEKVTKSGRLLFRLVPSERPTDGTGCGLSQEELLPTPTARDHKNGSKPEDNRTQRKLQQGWTLELNDMAAGGLLPAPTAMNFKGSVSPEKLKRKDGKMRTDDLKNIPVMIGQHSQQTDGATSQLNPLFVQEMMAFPYHGRNYLFKVATRIHKGIRQCMGASRGIRDIQGYTDCRR